MGLKQGEKDKLKILVDDYLLTGNFFWDESDKNKFRSWFYDLFLETFGQSPKCWLNAINKLNKEINRVP